MGVVIDMYDYENPNPSKLPTVAAGILIVIAGFLVFNFFSSNIEEHDEEHNYDTGPGQGSDNYETVIRTNRYTVEVVEDKPRGVTCWILDYTGGGSISCVPSDQTKGGVSR